MIELEYHRFITPSELRDLGNVPQWLSTLQKETLLGEKTISCDALLSPLPKII